MVSQEKYKHRAAKALGSLRWMSSTRYLNTLSTYFAPPPPHFHPESYRSTLQGQATQRRDRTSEVFPNSLCVSFVSKEFMNLGKLSLAKTLLPVKLPRIWILWSTWNNPEEPGIPCSRRRLWNSNCLFSPSLKTGCVLKVLQFPLPKGETYFPYPENSSQGLNKNQCTAPTPSPRDKPATADNWSLIVYAWCHNSCSWNFTSKWRGK